MTALALPERADYAAAINAEYEAAALNFIEVGDLLMRAKEHLGHGEFGLMCEADLRFGARHARRFMAIARDQRIRTHASVLPASHEALYQVTRLSDGAFKGGIGKGGWLNGDTERNDVRYHLRAESRQARLEAIAALSPQALPEGPFNVVVADPAFGRITWSDKGKSRDPSQHYMTEAAEAICAHPVSAMLADNAVLFLWVPGEHLPAGLAIVAAWDFEFKAQAVWLKDKISTGYWLRYKHENVLIATRGQMPAPLPGSQIDSVFAAPRPGPHSSKPETILDYCDRLYPGLAKIELNSRKPRDGWRAWGNQTEE